MFLGVNVFVKTASDELVNSWYENEKINIQQGNILSSVTKLQRSISTSALIKAVKVTDQLGREMVYFGNKEIDIKGESSKVQVNGNGIAYFRPNFYEYIYSFSTDNVKVYILTGSLLSLYLLIGILFYLICLLTFFGFFVRRETVTEEKIKSEVEINRIALNLKMSEKINVLATQVSHDIRSPTETLKMILEDIDTIPESKLTVIMHSLQRINDIASDLLFKNKIYTKELSLSSEALSDILSLLVVEKAPLIKAVNNVILDNRNILSRQVQVKVNKAEFFRSLSNILNNSIEALSKKGGTIYLQTGIVDQKVVLEIGDDGHGIPPEILKLLGEKGISYGKEDKASESGSGLGIYHAKKTVESFNGEFTIESVVGKGTVIKITLPIFSVESSVSQDNEADFYEYVYIDNDKILQLVWERKASLKNIRLLILKSTSDFDKHLKNISKDKTRIYLDSDLGEGRMRGEEFAAILHEKGYKHLYIATSYDATMFSNLPWLNHSGKKTPF